MFWNWKKIEIEFETSLLVLVKNDFKMLKTKRSKKFRKKSKSLRFYVAMDLLNLLIWYLIFLFTNKKILNYVSDSDIFINNVNVFKWPYINPERNWPSLPMKLSKFFITNTMLNWHWCTTIGPVVLVFKIISYPTLT